MRWVIVITSVCVLLLVALPLAALYAVVYTGPGLRTAVNLLPRHFAGVTLTITGVSGTLAHGVHADRVEVRHERVDLVFTDVHARAQLAPLMLQTLHLTDAGIGSASIRILPHRPSTGSVPIRFLPHWLSIRVDRLRLGTGELVLISGRRFSASGLEAAGLVRPHAIRFDQAQADIGAAHLTTRGAELRGGADVLGIAATVEVDAHPAGRPPWRLSVSGNGDLDSLELSARIGAPFQADARGRARLLAPWRFEGEADVHRLALDTWGGNAKLGSGRGTLEVAADAHGFTATGPVTLAALPLAPLQSRLRGRIDGHTLQIDSLDVLHRASGASASTAGSITFGADPRLDLRGEWRNLRLPLTGSPLLASPQGRYAVSGTGPYQLHGSGLLVPRSRAPMTFDLTARLFQDHVELDPAVLLQSGATARVTAALAWRPAPQWHAAGTVTGFDPEPYLRQLPGRVAFAFAAQGHSFSPATDLHLQLHDLAGTLRGLPAHAGGNIARDGGSWSFDGLRAVLGGTSMALDGSAGARLNLKFNLEAQDLGLLAPGIRGHLQASGTVAGTPRDPVIHGTASGTGLHYGRIGLEGFEASADFDPQQAGPSHVHLLGHGLTVGSRRADRLSLHLDGEAASHQVNLEVLARGVTLTARAQGGFAHGTWRGEVQATQLTGSQSLRLTLSQPVAVLLSPERMQVDQLCLKGEPATLCAGGQWSPQKWSLSASTNDLPISALTAGQSGSLDYRGVIALNLGLFRTGTDPVQGTLDARLSDARILHHLSGGRIETTTLGTGDVTVTATPDLVSARLGLDAGAIGSIHGEIDARRTPDWRAMPLSGSVALQTAELDFVTLYVPQIDRAAGRLSANLTVAGTVAAPLFNGTLTLAGGELDLYQINLAMRGAGLSARLNNDGLDFDGGARLGNGHASAHGHLTWASGRPVGSFELTGQNLRVADVPEAQIDASPDLRFGIDGDNITVTGKVLVPKAHFAPADLTNAVLPSSDEVLVGSEPRQGERFRIVSDITMTLGDQVDIDAMGLKGGLAGSITTHAASDDPVTRASGEFRVVKGQYTALGRKLAIDRGRLIFSGGPVGDPAIDVRAVKRFNDPNAGATQAGIIVRGTLRAPRLVFFSEPPLSQQQIVSLLLAGGGLSGGQVASTAGTAATSRNTNGELLGQAGAILGQQFGQKIGITDVGVESNIYNETSLVLGRYLSPRLYVSYGLGLTQTLNTVMLRYSLGNHWTIRTEFGQVGGADIVYTLDR
ncbi:MAG TPA: translocation/assembly module TamB domain-containing protein [Steroidobacteraceae bacterium]|nr:translocation/assembly module TamB domain-containing protein [Steroidobacteraceae bacterium]